MKDLINRVQQQLDNNHAVEADDIQKLVYVAKVTLNIDKKKTDHAIHTLNMEYNAIDEAYKETCYEKYKKQRNEVQNAIEILEVRNGNT